MEPSRISDCPSSPNCVSSQARDPDHRVDPISVEVAPDAAWEILRQTLAAEPRLRIVEERKDQWYLHAEATSLVFRFVDDVEFHLDPGQRLLHVRSASRVGHWDLGVNRRRVERLREALKTRGLWR
jgi:uncharacterized protein (DUF1499 family)